MTKLTLPLILSLMASPLWALELETPTALQTAPNPVCEIAMRLGEDMARMTRYPAPKTCPVIDFVVFDTSSDGADQMGAYDGAADRILLSTTMDMTSDRDLSYLYHELVHRAQYRAGEAARAPCLSFLEAEAYRLQADWLRARNLDEEARSATFLSIFLGNCFDPDEYH